MTVFREELNQAVQQDKMLGKLPDSDPYWSKLASKVMERKFTVSASYVGKLRRGMGVGPVNDRKAEAIERYARIVQNEFISTASIAWIARQEDVSTYTVRHAIKHFDIYRPVYQRLEEVYGNWIDHLLTKVGWVHDVRELGCDDKYERDFHRPQSAKQEWVASW